MARIVVLVIVWVVAVIFARAVLDTAVAVPRIVAEAEERAAW
jgi:hypothetical protein